MFHALDSLIAPLRDAHVAVYGNGFQGGFDREDPAVPIDISVVSGSYLRESAKLSPSGHLMYGHINDSLGYIFIQTFAYGDKDRGWQTEMADILHELSTTKGLVLDVRDNGGGTVEVMTSLASPFFPQTSNVFYIQVRSGPHHGDLTSPAPLTITGSEDAYTKPIVVLANRSTVSAGEWFTLAMRTLPNVKIVGDTTQGAFSGRLDRELSNGWFYSLSMEKITDMHGVCHEGIGIVPDLEVLVTRPTPLRDSVLDRAIELLEK